MHAHTGIFRVRTPHLAKAAARIVVTARGGEACTHVLVTAYVRTTPTPRTLLALASWSHEAATCELHVEWAALQLRAERAELVATTATSDSPWRSTCAADHGSSTPCCGQSGGCARTQHGQPGERALACAPATLTLPLRAFPQWQVCGRGGALPVRPSALPRLLAQRSVGHVQDRGRWRRERDDAPYLDGRCG